MRKWFMVLGFVYIIVTVAVLATARADEPPEAWAVANQTTVAWDAVEVDAGAVRYAVYLQRTDLSGAVLVGDAVEAGGTGETRYTVTLPAYGACLVGVRSVWIVDGERVAESEIGWSNGPAIATAGTFGVRFFAVEVARGLRRVE